MKIQLDTENKTIKLDSSVGFKELMEVLEKLLPKGLWKEFTLETNVTINNWSQPVIIEKSVPYYPHYPWWGQTYCGVSNTAQGQTMSNMTADNKTFETSNLQSGVYNVEC